MALILSVKDLSVTMGSQSLFEGLSYGIFDGEKIGLIGPNGSGKSTLLKIFAQKQIPDQGEVTARSGSVISYVPQETLYSSTDSVLTHLSGELIHQLQMDAVEAEVQASIHLSKAGFDDFSAPVRTLSGGWQKRLAIASAFAQNPDLLLLDEPTNHLDWDGIYWLETQLQAFSRPFVLVSHDRQFLANTTNHTVEVNKLYQDGYLSFSCSYFDFLHKKEEYIQSQLQLEQSLSNKARREVEWLRAGVKARTTKSRKRTEQAHELLAQVERVKSRNMAGHLKTNIEVETTGRKSKKFIECSHLCIGFDNHILIEDLTLTFGPQQRVGILGNNGSGKTTLMKTLCQKWAPLSGMLKFADDLKIVYFDQKRDDLPRNETVMQFLGGGSHYVVFRDQSIHVASYASRFLFASEKLNLPISQLSGGEQARLLLAQLLLQPADVLALDEPTNDLDIDTMEVLEQLLEDFPGLVLLVSHDREFLKQIGTTFIALEDSHSWTQYADLEQWLISHHNAKNLNKTTLRQKQVDTVSEDLNKVKVKLSYKDKKRLESIETEISLEEAKLDQFQQSLTDPYNMDDADKINTIIQQITQQQSVVDQLYQIWQTLEEKRQQAE